MTNDKRQLSYFSWRSVENCLPEMTEDGGLYHSKPVLLYLGNYQMVGYLEQWEDFPARWKLSGRDGYYADNVTHWRWLPNPPIHNN